jgi:hypothetical protein
MDEFRMMEAPGYEDIRAFVHKLLRCRKTDAAIATSNERDFSLKLTHVFLPLTTSRRRILHD